MRKIKRQLLADLYPQLNTIKLEDLDVSHLASLTPQWDILKDFNQLFFTITLNRSKHFSRLLAENPVNIHRFKPWIYPIDHNSLAIEVASMEVLAQTLKAMAIAYKALSTNDVEIYVEHTPYTYSHFVRDWQVHDNVIICRVESFLDFLEIMQMFEDGKDISESHSTQSIKSLVELTHRRNNQPMHQICRSTAPYFCFPIYYRG
jgi:hypothetical protein